MDCICNCFYLNLYNIGLYSASLVDCLCANTCVRMYEDEGTRGGVGRAEAARCGNGGKGTGGVVPVVPVGEQ